MASQEQMAQAIEDVLSSLTKTITGLVAEKNQIEERISELEAIQSNLLRLLPSDKRKEGAAMPKENSCAALIEKENASQDNLQDVIACGQPAASQCSACQQWFCDKHFHHQVGLCTHCHAASFAHTDDPLPHMWKDHP